METGERWFGRDGTPYAGVIATIEMITTRNVQVLFDRVVLVDGMQLAGEVMGKGKFKRMFEPAQQLDLF